MGAAREQRRQNHQVPGCEKPLLGLVPKRLSGSHDEAQPMVPREIAEMLDANPRKVRDFGVCEDFLARFNGYHRFNSSPAVSDIGPAYVGHLICQEGVAQAEDK